MPRTRQASATASPPVGLPHDAFVIRQARADDVDDLHALAKQTYFINLPPDRDTIAHKVDQSHLSFQRLALAELPGSARAKANARVGDRAIAGSGVRAITADSDLFLFVLEDRESRSVIGTSQVIASMGGADHPRLYMQLRDVMRSSRSLKIAKVHTVGRVDADKSGPTELGGLILNQAFRKHPARLGRLLSWVRFHMIGRYRRVFADRLVAEMLGPIRDGRSPFFDGFTSKFVEGSFEEMYQFSQHTREFLTSLLPEGDVFISIMPPEVKLATGEVSADTQPARHMLERLGFQYHNRIDPLDGGPHLEAATDRISLVSATRRVSRIELAPASAAKSISKSAPLSAPSAAPMILSTLGDSGEFRAVLTHATLPRSARSSIAGPATVGRSLPARVARSVIEALTLDDQVAAGATPVEF
jgi:arginine N-succinyltransferase